MDIRSKYGPKKDVISACTGKLLTEQQHAGRLNPNRIVAKAKQTGMLPTCTRLAEYGDFTQVTTFDEAQNRIAVAKELFMQLPARVRERFANSPARILEFLEDEKNREEAVKLGLIDAKKEEETPKPETKEIPAETPGKA